MRRYALACLLALLLPRIGACVPAQDDGQQGAARFDIRVKHIAARPLLRLLAEASRTDLVVGGEFRNERLNIDERDIDFKDMAQRLAAEQGLGVATRDGITLVGSACRLNATPEVPARDAFLQQITMIMTGLTTQDAFSIFNDFTGARFDLSQVNEQDALTLRIKDRRVRDVMSAIMTVEGWGALPNGSGQMNLVPIEQLKACAASAPHRGPEAEPALLTGPYTLPIQPCNRVTGRNCTDIQFFKLKELTPLGYFKSHASGSMAALVKASNGQYYAVSAGARIGDTGTVVKVADTGLIVEEEVHAVDGASHKRRRTLPYP